MDIEKLVMNALRKAGKAADLVGNTIERALAEYVAFRDKHAPARQGDGDEVLALKGFIDNIYTAQAMSAADSIESIRNNVVSIHWGRFYSNGLLITSNGYCLTAKHCVTKRPGEKSIIWRGKKYPLREKVCSVPEETDLALIKAEMKGPSEPRQYKVYAQGQAKMHTPVTMLSIMHDIYERKQGYVSILSRDYVLEQGMAVKDSLTMVLPGVRSGNSGSPIVNSVTGELLGLVSGGSPDIGTCSGAKSKRALEVVSCYAEYLRNKK